MQDDGLTGVDQLGDAKNTDAERHAAALTVCRYANDATDAAELLAALGLTPDAPKGRIAQPCRKCLRPMSNVDCVGHARRGSDGMCGSCYQRSRRGAVADQRPVVAVVDIETPLGVIAQGAEVSATPAADGEAWLLHFPGSRRTVTVAADAVRPAEGVTA
ncbi:MULTISPECIES: hypothetical protein [Nocardia]|uniref:hypothetical protein n=1 Tax=Nocardia TaxID=1817 RepID=UPI0007A3C9E0|nr:MULTISPECIES: hypothetical protein [Nocardia]